MRKGIKKKKYKVKVLDPKGNFINEIRKIKPKIVFNACTAVSVKMVIFKVF
jgi:hypothetical protein